MGDISELKSQWRNAAQDFFPSRATEVYEALFRTLNRSTEVTQERLFEVIDEALAPLHLLAVEVGPLKRSLSESALRFETLSDDEDPLGEAFQDEEELTAALFAMAENKRASKVAAGPEGAPEGVLFASSLEKGALKGAGKERYRIKAGVLKARMAEIQVRRLKREACEIAFITAARLYDPKRFSA